MQTTCFCVENILKSSIQKNFNENLYTLLARMSDGTIGSVRMPRFNWENNSLDLQTQTYSNQYSVSQSARGDFGLFLSLSVIKTYLYCLLFKTLIASELILYALRD